YTPARTNALPLADWLSAGRELHEDSLPVSQQRYAWFLGLALALLAILLVVSDRRTDFQFIRIGADGLKIHPTNLELQSSVLILSFTTTLLLAASPFSDAEDLLHQGNTAFARGDYETALGYYRQAEGQIADPGLLAFNEAAALYKLGRYREAEIHYWLARQDAAGERLARVLYDLGNAVFQQASSKDVPLLQRAIGFYEE